MQTKMVFVLLFMLSFTILHDSFITMMDKNEHTSISHYISDDAHSQECDIDEIHCMFHFVALITPFKSNLIQLSSQNEPGEDLLQVAQTYKESSDEPPKA
jgi:hypothetical protein